MTVELPEWWYRREARKLGASSAVLDDAVQEMKIAVWRGRSARHACIDFLRREFGRTVRRNEWPLQEGDAVATMDRLVDWLDFLAGFATLPERWRRISALCALGYHDVEIRAILGCSGRRVGQIRQKVSERLRSVGG